MIKYYFTDAADGSWSIHEADGGKLVKTFEYYGDAFDYCKVENEKYRKEEMEKSENERAGEAEVGSPTQDGSQAAHQCDTLTQDATPVGGEDTTQETQCLHRR